MLESIIDSAVAQAKEDGWDILPASPRWFRWREGRTAPGCTVLGAVLRSRSKNFDIPAPGSYVPMAAEMLGVDNRWILIFLRAQGDSLAVDAPFYPLDEDDVRAYELGLRYKNA